MHRILAIVSLLLFSGCQYATKTPQSNEAIAQHIQQAIPELSISAVRPAPISGLYEVQAGKNIYYADAEGRHLIVSGHIIDTKTHQDLTGQRLEEINRIDWSQLPLDKAIISGDPNAPLKLAVFTDPDCPFCKRLESMLKDAKGIRVYTFLYPLAQLHPDAPRKAQAIWCSKERHRTLVRTMLDGVDPGHATCENPLDDIAQLGNKLGIGGTPTLISGDGRRLAGAPRSLDALLNWLKRQ
ncbi:MAG: DsbC family protein [Zetaproteobacteria bacterium]|nr:MAG: DsbC family protein [Zetaproteobacteria bacterium]